MNQPAIEKSEAHDAEEDVRDALLRIGISLKDVAAQTGLSQATLSEFRRGRYRGDNERVSLQVRKWLDQDKLRSTPEGQLPDIPGFFETPTSKKIMSTLHYALMSKSMAVVYGAAGVGKTTAVHRFAETTQNVWVVTMSSDCRNTVPALEELALELDLGEVGGGAPRLRRAIVRCLEMRGGLLVIDEAQHLSLDAIESLRSVHDRAKVGLVFCGNEAVYSRITGGNRDPRLAQLYSRIGSVCTLNGSSAGDAAMILGQYTLDGTDVKDYLLSIAQQPGGLRQMVQTARLAMVLSRGLPIKGEHVKSAVEHLKGVA